MKKTIYETPQMEKDSLVKEILNLKNKHKKDSIFLMKNSMTLDLVYIIQKKAELTDTHKLIIKKTERYNILCTQSLF